ncbi:uncharacterized protein LOC130749465 isoform X3 [Lotus japonicus]|uniref:uncharacterized protein LOC130749465 isoform X3 n=1 Tax=Lotus japonicus TaxID=34305 RepID=UPI002587D1F4|nr:uncharacterized protein LOC130749465 isoform X3 [Lotus japonicus]
MGLWWLGIPPRRHGVHEAPQNSWLRHCLLYQVSQSGLNIIQVSAYTYKHPPSQLHQQRQVGSSGTETGRVCTPSSGRGSVLPLRQLQSSGP